MLRAERLTKILELVNQQKYVSAQNIIDLLGASRSTVLRDINDLSQEGRVKRTRGGIMKLETDVENPVEPSLAIRSHLYTKEKERIAAKGAVAGESCPAMRTYLIVGSNSTTTMRTGHARGRRHLPFLLTFSRLGPEPMITPGIHGYRRSDLLLVVTRVSAYSFDWSVHSS